MIGWGSFLLAQGHLAARLALRGYFSGENTFEQESQRLLVASQTQYDPSWRRSDKFD
jgi:hypothetical protein